MVSLSLSLFAALFSVALHHVTAQPVNTSEAVNLERERCGEIIDMHLHPVPPNESSPFPEMVDMNIAGVSQAVMYSVYAINSTLPDANTLVKKMVQQAQGRMVGLASCDMGSGDWNETKDTELTRLKEAMEEPEFVAAKIAPPHTCTSLNSTKMADIIEAVSTTSKPVVAVHIGSTPFCGPFGLVIFGYLVSFHYSYYVDVHLLTLLLGLL